MCYVKWNGMQPEMLLPLNYGSYQFREVVGGGYALQFADDTGAEQVLPLEDLVILRKMLCERDVAGDGNRPIYNTLSMVKASDEGFVEALNVSNKVRGIYKQKKAMLDPKDGEQGQKDFADRFAKAAKEGGVVGVDSMEDYTPLNITPYSANAAQMREVRDGLFTFWRTPERIVRGEYTEQQGMAWHESKICLLYTSRCV